MGHVHNIMANKLQQQQINNAYEHGKAMERLEGQKIGVMANRASAGNSNQMIKGYFSGQAQAKQLASKEATNLWKDPTEKINLAKQGITSFDQLLNSRMKYHMKNAIPIYGVTPSANDDLED